jgi:putative hydrolase of the HAD superfamily
LKTYKHLFFDLDNTLWDFKANAREAFYEVFTKLALHEVIPDFEKFMLAYEQYNEQMWVAYREGKIKKNVLRSERMKLTFAEMGIDDAQLAEQAGELYVQIAPQKSNLFEEVNETLGYLYPKYKLYILTNGFAEIQVQKISNAGLQHYFSKLFMAEMVGFQKPDRRFFEYAVKSLHAHKNECLMIGDDPAADIAGAQRAGIDQVFFNPSKKQCAVKPTWEISSMAALRDIL